jgi:hypothetical protein
MKTQQRTEKVAKRKEVDCDLQSILAARILTVDFVVCTLAVKKKKIRAGFNMSDQTIPLLELRKTLVKCYIWSIALYGVET